MLAGRKDVEDAFQRLDKLTPEEALMAAAETMTVTRDIDDTVKNVDRKLEGVDERVHRTEMNTENIEDKVECVDSRVQNLDEKVKGVDKGVKGVDDRVGSVIKGRLFFPSLPPNTSSPFTTPSLGVKETGVAIQQVFNQVDNLNRESYPNFITTDRKPQTLVNCRE